LGLRFFPSCVCRCVGDGAAALYQLLTELTSAAPQTVGLRTNDLVNPARSWQSEPNHNPRREESDADFNRMRLHGMDDLVATLLVGFACCLLHATADIAGTLANALSAPPNFFANALRRTAQFPTARLRRPTDRALRLGERAMETARRGFFGLARRILVEVDGNVLFAA